MNDIFGNYSYAESQSFDDAISELKSGLKNYDLDIEKASGDEEDKILKLLSQFSTFQNYDSVSLLLALKIKNFRKTPFLILMTFNSHDLVPGTRAPNYIKNADCELVGFNSVEIDPGHVFIRPETFSDKLIELIRPVEIDFDEDKEFSRKYYMVSDNEKQTRQHIDFKLLEAMKRYNDLHIEIKNKFLLARTLKSVSAGSIESIVGLFEKL